MAQPGDLGIRSEQRDGAAVGQHRVPLDGYRPLAVQPVPPRLQQGGEHPDGIQRLGHPVPGLRLARPDLDADVRPVQVGERVLVGHVVADEQHRTGSELHP